MDETAADSGDRRAYDGFMSYSHAADGLLAPRLQSALQRFARPWWKRRTMRIFRDESSLSANPDLWNSISEALDASDWFVLLLSPDAARSDWVNQEIQYWVNNRDPKRILPVVTDGRFGWADGEVTGDAVPPALHGVFPDEPRWVDLRFARSQEQLDLKNPTFSAAVADIASAIRGIPKDELESEEVRQHRRTVRTAWTAGALVMLLALTAGGLAISSTRNAAEAERQAVLAAEQAELAETNARAEAAARAEADANATAADANAAEAETQREAALSAEALAKARELAASAVAVLDRDPELSLLLALSSFEAAPPGESGFAEQRVAVRDALAAHRLLYRLDGSFASFVPGEHEIVVSSDTDRSVRRFDPSTENVLWQYRNLTTVDSFANVEVSSDGRWVALLVLDSLPRAGDVDRSMVDLDEEGRDPFPDRVEIIDASNGTHVGSFPVPDCGQAWGGGTHGFFSADASMLVLPCHTAPDRVSFVSTETWQEIAAMDLGSPVTAEGFSLTFADDMTLLAVAGSGLPLTVREWPELTVVEEITDDVTNALLAPDGRRVLVNHTTAADLRPSIFELGGDRVDRLDGHEGFALGMAISDDGGTYAVAGTKGVSVWDYDGRRLFHFEGPSASSVDFSADGSMVVSGHWDGSVRIWDLSDPSGTTIVTDDEPVFWFNSDVLLEGPQPAVIGFTPTLHALVLFDPQTGSSLQSVDSDVWATPLPDGRFAYVPLDDQWASGPLTVWNPATDTRTVIGECEDPAAELGDGTTGCAPGDLRFDRGVLLSLDGSTLAAMADTGESGRMAVRFWQSETLEPIRTIELSMPEALPLDWTPQPLLNDEFVVLALGSSAEASMLYAVFDATTGELVATLDDTRSWRGAHEVGAGGTRLYIGAQSGWVYEYDTSTWALVRSWQAQDGRLRGLGLSPEGRRLASTGEDGFVMVWDLTGEPDLLDRIPMPFPSDVMWIDDDELGVLLGNPAGWATISLDKEQLLGRVRKALTRSFSKEECRTYRVDPCESLEELKSR